MLKKWDEIPDFMKCEEVKFYYDILLKKKLSIKVKRIFDIALASFMLIILAVPMIIISIMIKIDSQGPVFYRQERITAYGKKFRIHKFRTMVNNADKIGTSVTIDEDSRITIVGSKLRSLRIDEIPQLLDVLSGNMSFVGTRPEATKYVEKYTKEMRATLLLPAGITSEASIRYKDEAKLLRGTENIDDIYSIVLIHDGVRPLVDEETITKNIECVKEHGTAITVSPAIETITVSDSNENSGVIKEVIERAKCQMARAPQGFYLNEILDVYKKAANDKETSFIDSATMMMHYGYKLYTVYGKAENIKITTPNDFFMFRAIVDARENSQIFGI